MCHTTKISPIVAASLCRDSGWRLQESALISWLSPRAELLLCLCCTDMQAQTNVKPEHHTQIGDWLFSGSGLLTAPRRRCWPWHCLLPSLMTETGQVQLCTNVNEICFPRPNVCLHQLLTLSSTRDLLEDGKLMELDIN